MPARLARFLCYALLLGFVPLAASAGSHLWRFEQFYSSQDRKVQFIVMREIGGSDIETNIRNHWYRTNSYNLDMSDLLGTNLPFGTANKAFLVGTQSYAALAAASPTLPDPDYVLPDGFFDPNGDTVVWWFYQTITIPPGVMPHDGYHAIRVIDPNIPTYATVVNRPVNFAGQVGSIPLGVPSQSNGTLALAALLLLASAWFARRALRRAAFARF
jgi:hypothetical protein